MVVVVTGGVYVSIGQNIKGETRKQWRLASDMIYLPGVSLGLTFAGLDALKPPMISVSVAETSTILIPGTTRSATTASA